MSRRTKYEIWVEILEVCLNSPRHQSWILRELRLKTNHVKESLQFLVNRNLIKVEEEDNDVWLVYRTTTKGKEALLHYYKLISDFFSN